MNYYIEYTTDVYNANSKHWVTTGRSSDTLEGARAELCDWLAANVEDGHDVTQLCKIATALEVGDEMRADEMDGYAHSYTLHIVAE